MKKILLTTGMGFFLIIFSAHVKGQCREIQANLDDAERQLQQLVKNKVPLDYSISLMEDDVPDITLISEEVTEIENAIKKLQLNVTNGDQTPETANQLQSLRNRSALLKWRMSTTYNQNSFSKDPKYISLKRDLRNIQDAEQDNKYKIAGYQAELKAYNCPTKAKKNSEDDIVITTDLDDKPEVIKRDVNKPDEYKPKVNKPDVNKPDVYKPDVNNADVHWDGVYEYKREGMGGFSVAHTITVSGKTIFYKEKAYAIKAYPEKMQITETIGNKAKGTYQGKVFDNGNHLVESTGTFEAELKGDKLMIIFTELTPVKNDKYRNYSRGGTRK